MMAGYPMWLLDMRTNHFWETDFARTEHGNPVKPSTIAYGVRGALWDQLRNELQMRGLISLLVSSPNVGEQNWCNLPEPKVKSQKASCGYLLCVKQGSMSVTGGRTTTLGPQGIGGHSLIAGVCRGLTGKYDVILLYS